MQIVIDTREQTPYTFKGYPATITPGTLTAGDYSLLGFESDVAIERKELSDLIGCLTHDRARFRRELERLRGYDSAALLIEAPFSAIAGGKYRSNMNPKAAVQSILAIMQGYRMPVLFADNRDAGQEFVYHFLRHFLRHAATKYKALAKHASKGADDE